jgi:hypothetical protein
MGEASISFLKDRMHHLFKTTIDILKIMVIKEPHFI